MIALVVVLAIMELALVMQLTLESIVLAEILVLATMEEPRIAQLATVIVFLVSKETFASPFPA